MGKLGVTVLAVAIGLAFVADAAEPDAPSEAALTSEASGVVPGKPFAVALRLTIAEGWHTYWRNPGDAGAPAFVHLKLPEGFASGPLQWPRPERFASGPLMSFGYSGEVMLLTEVTPPATLAAGSQARIAAEAEWLVCREICIPQTATLTLDLPVVDAPPPIDAQTAQRFRAARAALPEPAPRPAAFRASRDTVTLDLAGIGLAGVSDAWFYPLDPLLLDHRADQILAIEDGRTVLKLPRAEVGDAIPPALHGVITVREAGRDRAVAIEAYPMIN